MIGTPIELTPLVILLLALTGFASGFINAIAGGGGLIALPILLWMGVPPLNALATNKFQCVFGTLSSSYNYFRKGHLNVRPLLPALAFVIIGSTIGTIGVQQLSNNTLEQLLPYFLIGIALYTWFSPALNDNDSPALLSMKKFALTAGLGIGLYGGFFGPGTGAIAALSCASLLGYNMRKATAHGKPLVLLSNITSLIIFIIGGHVFWVIGIIMATTQIIGARLGSNLAIKKGSAIIKPLLLITTILIAVKLLVELYT